MSDFEQITQWITEMNRKKEYPKFDNCVIDLIEPYFSEPEIFISDDEKKCRYSAQYKLEYVKLNE